MKKSEMFLGALGAIVLLGIFGIVGRMDYEDWLIERQHYCHMRIVYQLDVDRGVPEGERLGWPNFKDEEYKCGEDYVR